MDIVGKSGLKVNGNDVWHKGNLDPASKLSIDHKNEKTHITEQERTKWNNNFRGNWTAQRFTIYGDEDKFYPIHITGLNMNDATSSKLEIYRGYSWKAPSSWNTSVHKGGLNLVIDYSLSGWGGQSYELQLYMAQTYSNVLADVITARPDTCTLVVWLRGGGDAGALYEIRKQSNDVGVTVYDGKQNPLPFKHKEGSQYEVSYDLKEKPESWFNFKSGSKKLLTSLDKLYVGGGYRNPKSSYEIYHEKNKPTPQDIGASPKDHKHTSDDITGLPTKLSQFSNDTDYVTKKEVSELGGGVVVGVTAPNKVDSLWIDTR